MPEPTVAIALLLMSTTALCLIGAMVAFFRADPGHRASRLALVASIALGLVAVFVPLLRAEAIRGLPFAIGSTLLCLAQVVFWSAIRSHGKNRPAAAFANDAPATLIARGPYRFVRHPFYVSYVLAFAGAAALAQASWTWLVPAGLAYLYVRAALQEEHLILSSPLGDAYRNYMQRTGAFVPRLAAFLGERAP